MTGSPWDFQLSELSTLNLQQFVNYCSDFLAPALVPGEVSAKGLFSPPVSCDSLYLFVCLSSFRATDFPCDCTLLMDLRRTVAFSVCSAIYLLQWNDDFFAPYTPGRKLKGCQQIFLAIIITVVFAHIDFLLFILHLFPIYLFIQLCL